MTAKKKVIVYVDEYKQRIQSINQMMQETAKALEDLSIQIKFIYEIEIPEAVQRRVLTGDRSQENKVRKTLEKLQKEHAEKSEDLIVIQNVLNRYKQQAADEIKQLQKLFIEERNIVAAEAYDRMNVAKTAYIEALQDTVILHVYRDLERGLQEVEVAAGRRKYVDTVFPIDQLKLNALSLNQSEITNIVRNQK